MGEQTPHDCSATEARVRALVSKWLADWQEPAIAELQRELAALIVLEKYSFARIDRHAGCPARQLLGLEPGTPEKTSA